MRLRRASLSLVVVAPLSLWAAQVAAARLAPAGAWGVFALAAFALGAHLVAIDCLVCHWMLTLFPHAVRYSAIALCVNVGTMLFVGPAPAVEAALAGTSASTHWLAGLFLTLTGTLGALCTRLGEDSRRT